MKRKLRPALEDNWSLAVPRPGHITQATLRPRFVVISTPGFDLVSYSVSRGFRLRSGACREGGQARRA